MKKYKFSIKGHQFEVDILHVENNVVELELNGTAYAVEVAREVKATKTPRLVRAEVPKPRPEETAISRRQESTYPLKAPLPGLVRKVLVKEGDTVRKGDTLLIMEAMKMENNLFAEKDGKVVRIAVREGENVLQDDLLLEME